ncbi:MAG: glutathione-disulfide reductase [Deltaproteobacteria bacterium]|nr:MAG: glutathione-disulfide reductase [Deltaproteobacteria bacterium]
MADFDYDLFVIGGGSGGVRAARIAAGHGARVALAEEYRYGGTCVIRGCVPKKLFVYASHFADDFRDAEAYGWRVGATQFDWPTLVAAKDREIDRLSAIYAGLLDRAGVTRFDARARLADPHTVEVGGRRVTARIILVATGGTPWKPSVPGVEYALTSNEMFHLPSLPRTILVVGGGYIAVEFACILSGFGVAVTLMYRRDKVLRGFDDDVRDAVQDHLAARGIELRMNANIERIERLEGGRLRMHLDGGGAFERDAVLCATGRRPNTDDLGLRECGVDLGPHGAIVVDEMSRTSVPSIYAVGDVTDRINLTPVALHEGHAFADSVFGGKPRPVDHECVPSAVFSQPPVATVGLTEAQARDRYPNVHIYRSRFTPLKHTLTGRGDHKTLMKLVVDGDSDRVLGAHMVGDDAPEIIQCIAIAVKMGATKADFDRTIGIHPTSAEEWVTMRTRVA